MTDFKTMLVHAARCTPSESDAIENIEVVLGNELDTPVRDLSDAAFRMWFFAIIAPDKWGPDHWSVDTFREALGFSAAKVSRAAQELMAKGFLRRELINKPGTRGRTSLWYFVNNDEAVHLADELDPNFPDWNAE